MKRNGHAGSDDAHALSPRVQAALARRLRRRRESAAAGDIPRCSREGSLPLSFAQERLWFLDQLMPGSPAYNRILALRLQGALDVDALTQGLDEIYRRHEALRTTFPAESGSPAQAVSPPEPPGLPVTDLRQLPAAERPAEARRLADAAAAAPYDLGRGPLWRPGLLRLAENDSTLLLAAHHIVSDGWSDGVLWRELAVLYRAYHEGRASPLPEPPIQYADYAAWQQEWLQGEVLEQLLAYWQPRLAGPLPALDLPTDHPRPPIQGWRGAKRALRLPVSLSAGLQALSRREGATLFATLLAAFCALLYRHSGQKDLIIGMPIAGRNRSELEGLIGLFVNTLPLRMDLSGDPPFRDLLAQARGTALDALGHQEIPLEKLVQALRPERSLDRSPLFQAMLNLRNMPQEPMELPGLAVSPYEVSLGTALVDLDLEVTREDDTLACSLRYNTDLYEAPTIQQMLGHLETLLSGIVADPGRRLSALPLLTEGERQTLIEWNAAQPGLPCARCLHELIEAQVERTPSAPALTFEDQTLTYQQVNARANQLAHYLRRRGVGPECLVGLHLERSPDMVIALLAVLKAGGAYLPLDPSYPAERLVFMLRDAQPRLVLTQESLWHHLTRGRSDLPAGVSPEPILVDRDWPGSGPWDVPNPTPSVGPHGLAYVIYTSGSTGQPKGVMVEHQGLANLHAIAHPVLGLTRNSTIIATSSLSFDTSVLDLLLPLTVGAHVVLASREVAADGTRLLALLIASEATALCMTPSGWRVLLEAGWAGTNGLRMVTGGEAIPRELADELLARGACLWNTYGPTETTVTSIGCQVEAGAGPVPIGQPFRNVRVHILDPHQQPVPIGVPGEICIGGVGVARGYLNQPEWTAQRFIADPFSAEPGARLFRTGDQGRFRPDGNIEFLGRLDRQVKIRGFRIEPGEIEGNLLEHPAVRQAAVVVREDTPGEKRLVAYLVVRAGETLSPTELRHFLRQRLPAHMVPAAFVLLDTLPVNANGKLDRAALPPPVPGSSVAEAPYVAPRTPMEELVARLWADLLGCRRVGIHDGFFELGGHSLLAMQIVARLRDALQVSVPLRRFFEAPTVADLALLVTGALLEQAMGDGAAQVPGSRAEDGP